MPNPSTNPVLCLGEALIDVIIRDGDSTDHVGGSPLNVARGLAALDHPTQLAAWFGNDERGALIEEFLTTRGIGIAPGSDAAPRTPVAYARLDEAGRATYEFDLDWQVPALPEPDTLAHLHTGSFAATLEPGATAVLAAVKRMAIGGTVSYDPNVRPTLMGEPGDVRDCIEQLVALSDVVKASDEDLAWLYGEDTPVETVMRRWMATGPGLVVVTRGPWGAYALLAGDRDMLVVDPLNVEIADTVGAGDSFMAGLLSGLLDAGLIGSPAAKSKLRNARWENVRGALHRAVVTSGLTVSRAGAYGPTRGEVARIMTADPRLV